MIIPTPEFDPMFAEDGAPYRDKMVNYIRREFAAELGARMTLLQTEAGLEQLSNSIQVQITPRPRRSAGPRCGPEH